jgi:hypothetical protein
MNCCRKSICIALVLCTASSRAADTIYQIREQLDREYAHRLEQLAVWCEQQALPEAAKRTREWFPANRAQRLLLFDPTQAPEKPPASETPATMEWRKKFVELRTARAKELFHQAQRCQRPELSLAVELAGGALREDPDNAGVRKVFGYDRTDGSWHTAFTLAKQKANQVWDDQFGWLPQARVARYQAGERYYRGRWISAEQDARLHAKIDTGWELATEHFSVITNHSLEAAARFGRKLEQLYVAWLQVCGSYALSSLDELSSERQPRRRHEVMVFRNRAEYLQALRGEVPENVTTSGIYISRRRTAYFYVPESPDAARPAFDDTVLFHEAVHQLFSEASRAIDAPGEKRNFWLIEGIACYFESLTQRDGYLTVGGTDAERFRAARYRLLNDQFYVPLEELSKMDRLSLQRHARIAQLYSQSAGLTHFLIHSEHGRRRQGLIETLKAVYSGRDNATALSEAVGQDYSKLDEAYRQFMQRAE